MTKTIFSRHGTRKQRMANSEAKGREKLLTSSIQTRATSVILADDHVIVFVSQDLWTESLRCLIAQVFIYGWTHQRGTPPPKHRRERPFWIASMLAPTKSPLFWKPRSSAR